MPGLVRHAGALLTAGIRAKCLREGVVEHACAPRLPPTTSTRNADRCGRQSALSAAAMASISARTGLPVTRAVLVTRLQRGHLRTIEAEGSMHIGHRQQGLVAQQQGRIGIDQDQRLATQGLGHQAAGEAHITAHAQHGGRPVGRWPRMRKQSTKALSRLASRPCRVCILAPLPRRPVEGHACPWGCRQGGTRRFSMPRGRCPASSRSSHGAASHRATARPGMMWPPVPAAMMTR
jgi:hypothetical protein